MDGYVLQNITKIIDKIRPVQFLFAFVMNLMGWGICITIFIAILFAVLIPCIALTTAKGHEKLTNLFSHSNFCIVLHQPSILVPQGLIGPRKLTLEKGNQRPVVQLVALDFRCAFSVFILNQSWFG